MSIQAINWALNLITGITSTQKAILISLADRANEDGQCWPSYDDICTRSCASRHTVARSLKKMEELGLISRVRRFSKSTVYQLHISAHLDTISSAHIDTISSVHLDTITSAHIDTLTINESSKEPKICELFDQFWSKYPRKTSKVTAERAFKKLSKKDKKSALDGVDRYPFSSDKQFIAHASTWINQRRWEDEFEDKSSPSGFEI